ncbi:MAG: Holliday junction resolvase RuvX [Clostridia bacterium]|nr:Holliday junction resolvase RuvX [Clostridia bacterium]
MSRVLGLDVGDRRIGVALSDEGQLIASPLTVIQSVGWGPDSREILRLMREHGADLIVCGLPRNMDGSEGFQAEKVRRFMQVLIDQGVPVAWMDERLTTVSAQRALIEGGVRREDRKKSVDKVAAAVILQAWLDNAQNEKEKETMANDEEILRPDEEPEEEEVPDVIELTDEDGATTRFEYITTIDHEGTLYIALMPIEDEENADDENGYVVFMQIEQDEQGEDYYVSVDDDALVDVLFEKLTQMLDEEE